MFLFFPQKTKPYQFITMWAKTQLNKRMITACKQTNSDGKISQLLLGITTRIIIPEAIT